MQRYLKGYIKNFDKHITVQKGINLLDLISIFDYKIDFFPVAAVYNNQIVDLRTLIMSDFEVEFLNKNSRWGASVYRRSLTHILMQAVYELFPQSVLHIGQSLANGYYFDIEIKGKKFDKSICKVIERKMSDIIKQRRIFEIILYDIKELKDIFLRKGFHDKCLLLNAINQREILAVKCGKFIDIYHGPYVPHTGYIDEFSIMFYKPGFVLKYPKVGGETVPLRNVKSPKLFNAYKETAQWNRIMGVENVADLNKKVLSGEIDDIIMIAEGFHENKIVKIADEILRNRHKTKLVLIAGPSSSGKTTFSRRLRIQLEANGIKTVVLGTDDYFVDRRNTPKNEKGEYDFESIYAIDLDLFNEHLKKLLQGKKVKVPKFNFKTGRRFRNKYTELELRKDEILVIEGIHSLNPVLTKSIPDKLKYKVYVSALTQLCIDSHNRIFTSDTRLIRRIVRDRLFRGYGARKTVKRWPSVREGEEKNIFPYQENADAMFNSALIYEHSILKTYAERFLKEISPQDYYYVEASRLLDFLDLFVPLTPENIPSNSILREFIGGSIFHY